MLLFIPTERKYKKEQKGKKFNRVQLTENITNNFITRLGLKSLQSGRVTSKQLNSFLRCLRKYLKKKTVLIKLSIFPHTPITKKPVGVRMGKGKGNV
jgi:large subunit ribosomal protein L16